MGRAFRMAVLTTLAAAAPPAFAQTLSEPVRANVAVVVAKAPERGVYDFRYQVANPATSRSQIRRVELDLTLGTGETRLPREGLVNAKGYRRTTSEASFQQVSMVPVGMAGPMGWAFGLGVNPAGTEGYASWGSRDEPFRILPGQVRHGFGLTSHGLPGIREVRVRPPIDSEQLPEEYEDPDRLAQFVDTLTFRTKTVGPKAPPAQFVPLDFLNYLVSLLHQSREQGWVKVEGVHRSLLAKLLAAKRALEAGRAEPAAGEIKAFLNEVQAVACQEFSCPGNRPLTSEAYALLYFNAEYLAARLPAPAQKP